MFDFILVFVSQLYLLLFYLFYFIRLISNQIVQALQQKGIIDDILRSLNPPPLPPSQPSPPQPVPTHPSPPQPPAPQPALVHPPTPSLTPPLNPSKRYLYLRVVGGRAFVEHLINQHEVYYSLLSSPLFYLFFYFLFYVTYYFLQNIHNPSAMLVLQLHMMNQRFKTQPVPCSVEPAFSDSFFFELQVCLHFLSPPALNAINKVTLNKSTFINAGHTHTTNW